MKQFLLIHQFALSQVTPSQTCEQCLTTFRMSMSTTISFKPLFKINQRCLPKNFVLWKSDHEYRPKRGTPQSMWKQKNWHSRKKGCSNQFFWVLHSVSVRERLYLHLQTARHCTLWLVGVLLHNTTMSNIICMSALTPINKPEPECRLVKEKTQYIITD